MEPADIDAAQKQGVVKLEGYDSEYSVDAELWRLDDSDAESLDSDDFSFEPKHVAALGSEEEADEPSFTDSDAVFLAALNG